MTSRDYIIYLLTLIEYQFEAKREDQQESENSGYIFVFSVDGLRKNHYYESGVEHMQILDRANRKIFA